MDKMVHINYLGWGREKGLLSPLPLGAWEMLRYFIVAPLALHIGVLNKKKLYTYLIHLYLQQHLSYEDNLYVKSISTQFSIDPCN